MDVERFKRTYPISLRAHHRNSELWNITREANRRMGAHNSIVPKGNRWPTQNGSPVIWYSYGHQTTFNLDNLRKQMNAWSEDTCLVFKQMPKGQCRKPDKLDHGVLNIATLESYCCFADTGYRFGSKKPLSYQTRTNFGAASKCQQMCIDRSVCIDDAHGWLLAFSLGLMSPLQRPDRDDFVTVHSEWMSVNMWPSVDTTHDFLWSLYTKCDKNLAGSDVPVPFDFGSMTLPPTTFAYDQDDFSALITSKDPAKQYIINQHRGCGLRSHLDKYQIITAYGCDKKIRKNCESLQKPTHKCKNYGYLTKDCKCACNDGYTGASCETKINMQGKSKPPSACYDNYRILRISKTGFYNMSDLQMVTLPGVASKDIDPDLSRVGWLQFLSVIVNLPGSNRTVSAAISHPTIGQLLHKAAKREHFLYLLDCSLMRLYWGPNKYDKVRTDCLSYVASNEPEPSLFRSRTPGRLDMTFQTFFGSVLEDTKYSVEALQLQIEISTYGRMKSTYSDGNNGNANGTGNGENGDGWGGPAAQRAIVEKQLAGGLAVTLGAGILLLFLFIALAVWFWKFKSDDDMYEEEDDFFFFNVISDSTEEESEDDDEGE